MDVVPSGRVSDVSTDSKAWHPNELTTKKSNILSSLHVDEVSQESVHPIVQIHLNE